MIFLLLMLSCVNFKLENGEKITQEDFNGIVSGMKYDPGKLLELKKEDLRGVDVNAVDNYQETALIKAVRSGEKEVCELLLEKGANTEATDYYGKTALIVAAANGKKEICELLLEAGADVNAVDNSGETALTRMVKMPNPDISKILLEYGADINVVNSCGMTILELARYYGNKRLKNLLESYFNDPALFSSRVKVKEKILVSTKEEVKREKYVSEISFSPFDINLDNVEKLLSKETLNSASFRNEFNLPFVPDTIDDIEVSAEIKEKIIESGKKKEKDRIIENNLYRAEVSEKLAKRDIELIDKTKLFLEKKKKEELLKAFVKSILDKAGVNRGRDYKNEIDTLRTAMSRDLSAIPLDNIEVASQMSLTHRSNLENLEKLILKRSIKKEVRV